MESIENLDLQPYYEQQNQLKSQVIQTDELPDKIQYIAGVDVAYNEAVGTMIGAIVVLDATTLEVLEQAHHEMEITFPYVPGLFSFREVPAILEAYQKLTIQPDIIVCDAQGVAHPKGVGMATHLGILLQKPTIGCAKKRLIGSYDKSTLGKERGAIQELILEEKVIGIALRTQTDIKPMFVSIGHKVSLATAKDWVLRLCPEFRLPETTRQADQLVNKLRKQVSEL